MRISALIILAACVLAAPASAGPGGVEPLDRILSHLRAERGGTFYDAEGPFADSGGNIHYRIKWLTPDGQLIWLDTDARTGRVLGVDRGDYRGQAPPRGHDNNHRRDQFGDDQGSGGDYDHAPRENLPRDPRWPHWQGGGPVGGGDWRGHGDHDDHGDGDHGGHHHW